MIKTDFLVIGSGIAGLTFALKTAQKEPGKKITIITKADESESNTKYAQGGVAIVNDKSFDSFEQHINDTLVAGDGLCDKKVVKAVIKEGPVVLKELINWGVHFDMKSPSSFELGKEGGHSKNRIIHHGDSTGLEIEKTLLSQIHRKANITMLSHYFAIDLITEHHIPRQKNAKKKTCYGAYILNEHDKKIEKVLAKITLIATGGIGQVYKNTTNPIIATGDGIAMAYRAGAEIKNMEFVQFHPSALYNPGSGPSFLISEAVRGDGAILRTKSGERFMQKYDTRQELASRDIVAKAIDTELKKSGDDFVYLDCRNMELKKFKKHFPTIYNKCIDIGIDITKKMIPVVPVAHYLCGGIKVNEWGMTNIKNLYACGEAAYTGLHGANRLASNSLLEALVYANRCYEETVKKVEQIKFSLHVPDWNATGTFYPKEMILITQYRRELQEIMSNYVGIVRTDDRLKKALDKLKFLKSDITKLYKKSILSPPLIELRNMAEVALLIVIQSIKRKENKGVFYNSDLS